MNEKIEKIDARSSYAEVGYVKVQINDWNTVMSDFKKLRSENEGKQNEIVALRKTVLACEDENSALKARWDIIWKRIKGRRDFFIWHSDKLSQPDKVIGTLKPDSKKQEAGT